MTAFPYRCGRLDAHDPHEWSTPHTQRRYACSGRVVIEGGWREQDDADDAAEEQAIRARREVA